MPHVGGGGGDTTGSNGIENFKADGITSGAVAVALGRKRFEFLGRWLVERGMGHAKRGEDVVGYIPFERLAANSLDDVAAKADSIVGVPGNKTRREEAARLVADEEIAEGGRFGRLGQNDVANRFFEAA